MRKRLQERERERKDRKETKMGKYHQLTQHRLILLKMKYDLRVRVLLVLSYLLLAMIRRREMVEGGRVMNVYRDFV